MFLLHHRILCFLAPRLPTGLEKTGAFTPVFHTFPFCLRLCTQVSCSFLPCFSHHTAARPAIHLTVSEAKVSSVVTVNSVPFSVHSQYAHRFIIYPVFFCGVIFHFGVLQPWPAYKDRAVHTLRTAPSCFTFEYAHSDADMSFRFPAHQKWSLPSD